MLEIFQVLQGAMSWFVRLTKSPIANSSGERGVYGPSGERGTYSGERGTYSGERGVYGPSGERGTYSGERGAYGPAGKGGVNGPPLVASTSPLFTERIFSFTSCTPFGVILSSFNKREILLE